MYNGIPNDRENIGEKSTDTERADHRAAQRRLSHQCENQMEKL